MNTELLKKYFNNTCTTYEVDEVILWFKNSANGLNGRTVLNQLWNELEEQEIKNVDFDNLLDKIHHRINIENTQKIQIEDKKNGTILKRIIPYFYRVAAVFFIPLLFLSLYYYYKTEGFENQEPIYSEITSPNGSRTSFELPDGSKVWLNNGSSLKFPIRFTGDYRKIELVGEAYFYVAHNQEKPLIVKTRDIQVKVHGTEFNVMAYPDEENVYVTLEKGSISLEKENNKKEINSLIMLKPNQQAIFNNQENKLSYKTINPTKYTAWKEGKLIFIDDPINEIMRRLERWYNVDIELKDSELSEFSYTATFTNESLNQILYLLKLATPIDYKIIESKKLKDGSFTRKKVTITMK